MVEVVQERCCGLDVHQQTVVACLITPGQGGPPQKEIRTFGTMTADLLELADWLRAAACPVLVVPSGVAPITQDAAQCPLGLSRADRGEPP